MALTGSALVPSTARAARMASTSTVQSRRACETRAIVLEFNIPMLIDVLVDLSQNSGWNPVYVVSNYTKDRVKHHFPSAIYQDTIDARYGRAAADLADMTASAVMDQATAEALGYEGL